MRPWRGSGGAVLRRDQTMLVFSLGNLDIFLRATLYLAVTRPRVLAKVNGSFWTNFMRFLRDGGRTDPEVNSLFALKSLDNTSTRSLYLALLRPDSTVHGGLWNNFLREGIFTFSTGGGCGVFSAFESGFSIFRTPSGWTRVPIFSPPAITAVSARGIRGLPESPGVLLPGDSAHVCTIHAPMTLT